jgi:penicillin-binding protein 1C
MRRAWRIAPWVGAGLALAATGAGLAFVRSPPPAALLDYGQVSSLRIHDRQGRLLRERLSGVDGRSSPLAADAIPPHVRDAFLAAEDHRFSWHPGVDPVALGRAALANLRAGKVVSGGSTLSQQLARMLVPRPRTLGGKVKEALWALRLEAHLGKDELLAQYLNRVPLGNGTFGVEAASRLYFARPARSLSVGQAAMLASLPRGPTAYNPYRHPRRLEHRRQWVLRRMVQVGRLSAEAHAVASEAALDLGAPAAAFRAPHFVEHLTRRIPALGLGDAAQVHTTLDGELQALLEDVVRAEVERLRDRNVGSAAVLVVDNATGEVLAYVGSADFFDEARGGQNDGVQMRRQPGSALKPFAYLEAFRHGYTAASVLADVPTGFPGPKGAYSPENYDRRKHGPVRAREALGSSYNIPAVRLAEALGPQRLLEGLRAAGFESLGESSEHYGLGLVLGNGEVSLWEAARAYSGLSRGAVLRDLRLVRSATSAEGRALALPPAASRRFAAPAEVALVTHVLSDNAARARAFGLDSALRLPFPVAAKTGTSKGYSDNWLVGYTRERTVAVWAGNFDGAPMRGVSGITGAGPIFRAAMVAAMRGVLPAPLWDPALLEPARICPLSGELATGLCPSAMDEVFARGTAPPHDCRMHAGRGRALPAALARRCDAAFGPSGAVTDLGPDYYDWARAEGLYREPHLAAACREEPARPHAGPARFTFPSRGAQFVLLDDLPVEHQSIPVRIRAAATERLLELRVDGEPLFTLTPPFTGRLPARLGAHRLSVHRPGDPRPLDEVRFVVREQPQRF